MVAPKRAVETKKQYYSSTTPRTLSSRSRRRRVQVRATLGAVIVFSVVSYTTTLGFVTNRPSPHRASMHTSSTPDSFMLRLARLGGATMSRTPKNPLTSSMTSTTTATAADTMSATGTSAATLHELASKVIRNNQDETCCRTFRACLAVAGGGSTAISALAATPGASQFLNEGIVTYDRRSFAEFVSRHPPPPPGVILVPKGEELKFASPGAAMLLANAALHQSLQLCSFDIHLRKMQQCIGVGCASSLTSNNGNGSNTTRIHMALSTWDGHVHVQSVTLNRTPQSTRLEEETITSNWILHMISQQQQQQQQHDLDTGASVSLPGTVISKDFHTDSVMGVMESAEAIVHGKRNAVILIPKEDHMDSAEPLVDGMKAMVHTVLPADPIIFPGSFNPPHVGHLALARAAVKAMMRKEAESERISPPSTDILQTVWNAAHTKTNGDAMVTPTVLFEMSLTNPDKPPMEASEAVRRISLFEHASSQTSTSNDPIIDMPEDWGILLTSAPLFVDKVDTFKQYLSSSSTPPPSADGSSSVPPRQMTFVIGADTMIRILNPKYYGNSFDAMLAAVRNMRDNGVHFVVGGRVEQGTQKEPTESRFVTGANELSEMPEDIQNCFTLVREEDFRLDLSSTEIRNQQNT